MRVGIARIAAQRHLELALGCFPVPVLPERHIRQREMRALDAGMQTERLTRRDARPIPKIRSARSGLRYPNQCIGERRMTGCALGLFKKAEALLEVGHAPAIDEQTAGAV